MKVFYGDWLYCTACSLICSAPCGVLELSTPDCQIEWCFSRIYLLLAILEALDRFKIQSNAPLICH